ncbi:sulfate/molybdate ABC transporter ATP-binding protein [Limobrevibacterium gyesilva]|uniref:Sulfate ABC transporter ATP-binding protein n=1 Tax=Limobrevibacterium gyesilva TaxID=2991712 RepID=A0AA41YRY6_9PROT|nr:sulfate ABC transporter ATP-binding protein [Limobrevibacterium gyesilva]MCW3475493.1 sulfate ABC transporter ATP-binding protein [Limobrevibacterium gyesilva]
MTAEISIRGVTRRFGAQAALDGVDLDVRPGELLALLGPSGSGKTTLLRIIAGLEWPDSGTVMFGGQDAMERHVRERGVGFVFQHYALFRHMTVFENVAFGLRVRPRAQRLPRAEIARRVHTLLNLVQLDWLADRYPNQLSGGQRQRVALARALAIEPRVLLLDEPFGALDAKVRKELRRWLRSLHENVKVTSVFVTHDQEEALELADRVVVMANGRIEQVGTPAEVYCTPASAFVHEFLGDTNRLECRVEGGRALLADGTPIGRAEDIMGSAIAYVRPHDVTLAPAADGPGIIRHVHAVGPLAQLVVELGGVEIDVAIPADSWARLGAGRGDRVAVTVQAGTLFPQRATRGIPMQPLLPASPILSLVRNNTVYSGRPIHHPE